MNVPEDLRYSKEHEWVRVDGETAVIGITDYAQDALGDIVFAELPEVGSELGTGDAAGELESVKAVSDVYMPASGEVLEINEALDGAEDALNTGPYGAGWMFKIRLSDASELDGLMNSEAYKAFLDNT